MDTVSERAVIQYLHKKGISKDIHTDMVATLGNDAPSYVTVKMWVAHFKATIPALVDLHSKIQNKKKSSISQVFIINRIHLCISLK